MNGFRNSALALLSLVASLTLSTASAHHGARFHFDLDTTIVVEGTVVENKVVNPHSYVYFDVVGNDGEVEHWRCETSSQIGQPRGFTRESILPGDHIRVTGSPSLREEHACHTEKIEHEDGRTIPFRGGLITEGTSTYVPGDSSALVKVGDTADTEPLIIATGGSEAAARVMVDVPTEGFFGYWAAPPGADGGGFAPNRTVMRDVVAGVLAQTVLLPDGVDMELIQEVMGRAAAGALTAEDQALVKQLLQLPGVPRIAAVESDLPAGTDFMVPDLTPEGQAMTATMDPRFDAPQYQCRGGIFNGLVHYSLPNEFVQVSDNTIRWVYGYMDMVRTIHMDHAGPPENLEAAYMGHSFGRWEGDTLVVETTGFRKDRILRVCNQ